ncbi:MAG: CHAP domain-containing protein [Rhodocyclaceae bacterium]
MQYPNHVVKVGEADAAIVKALKKQLNLMLVPGDDENLRLDPQDPNFGPKMKRAVKLFQARHVDNAGRPLKQDGEVGSLTWEALFGAQTVTASENASGLLAEVLKVAAAEEAKKVREQPRNSNRGPQVDLYLRSVGLDPGYSWCCAFVYYCFEEAAKKLRRANPMVRTGGCLKHWQDAPKKGAARIAAAQAFNNPALLRAGMIFIMDHGKGLGHTGLIESVSGGLLTTIEGNTDASLTREGGGVYRLVRKVADINKGYIDYSGT